MNRAKELIQTIKSKGLTVNKVEREAGVQAGTLRRWSENEPKSFEMESNIKDAIKNLSDEIHSKDS